MRPPGWLGAAIAGTLVAALLSVSAAVSGSASAQQGDGLAAAGNDLTVSLSMAEVWVRTGETFTFSSQITNHGLEATPPLIANLNFVATDRSTYVDPEDWSPQRTVRLHPIAPGASASQTWTVKPVLGGDIAAYVVVLPEPPALANAGPLAASPALRLHVEERRPLNPGGVLPVIVAVPGVLALAFVGLQLSRWARRL